MTYLSTIERQHNGSYLIYDSEPGYFFKRVYYGYTKREAYRIFRQELKEEMRRKI